MPRAKGYDAVHYTSFGLSLQRSLEILREMIDFENRPIAMSSSQKTSIRTDYEGLVGNSSIVGHEPIENLHARHAGDPTTHPPPPVGSKKTKAKGK